MAAKDCALLAFAVFLLMSGCGPKPGAGTGENAVVSINDYKITRGEFESEFKNSVYSMTGTVESRQNFLNTLIDRQLLLQYAQKEGFDKEALFLKAIEKFWEQSLLKVVLDKKMLEIAAKNVAGGWEVQRAEDAKEMNNWISELRKGARITVHEGALKNTAGPKGGR